MSKKIIVAGMLVFCILFGCAFSYAAFTSSISVGGHVSAKGDFDVFFVKNMSNEKFAVNDKITASNTNVTVTVSGTADVDKNAGEYDTLTFSIEVPFNISSDCTFPVYVHNAGTVTATIAGTTISDNDNNNRIQLSCKPVSIEPGKTDKVDVTIHKVNTLTAGTTYSGIQLKLVYTQPDVASAPKLAHSHS